MSSPFPYTSSDCSCKKLFDASGSSSCFDNCGQCRCIGTPCLFTPGMKEITQKRIQNQVRIDTSQYIDVLSDITIQGGKKNLPINLPKQGFYNVNQSQSSDRNRLHIQTRYVPGPGSNSTRSSITRLRPGSLGPAGKNAIGVDVKHNSFDRYLGRLKAKSLGASWKSGDNPNTLPPPGPFPSPIYYERFSKINYGILGNGLCNICDNE